jgi:hypothetical protein
MRAQTISLSRRRKKKLERQIEKYLTALKSHPNDYKIHIDLGDAYIELDDAEKGVSEYYDAIDLLREAPNMNKIRTLILGLYEKIIDITPDAQRAYIELSNEYLAAEQKEKAFRFLLSSAKKAYAEENYELALTCYNQAITNGRTNPYIVERCTELYMKLDRKEEALQNYVKIGDMYAQEEKNIDALEYYKKACALDQNNPNLRLRVAHMYNAMGWTENAASELVKVGEYYEQRHEYTEALRYYNYSVRLDPENEKAQEGRFRVNQSPSLDGLVLREDPEEIRPNKAERDVFDELDRVEDAAIEEDANSHPIATQDDSQAPDDKQLQDGLFSTQEIQEMLALDDEVDLEFTPTTFGEGESLASAIDNAPAELTPEGPLPENLLLLDEDDEQASSDIIELGVLSTEGQEASDSEQEAAPQLDTLFTDEDRERQSDVELKTLQEDTSPLPSSQGKDSEFIGSLDDWIIDLKEDELVELALEDALEEQETVESENWNEMLGLDLSSEQDMSDEHLQPSFPETTKPEERTDVLDDMIDIQIEGSPGHDAIEEASEGGAVEAEDDESTVKEADVFLLLDESPEQALDTFLGTNEKIESSAEAMSTEEDAVRRQDEILLEIDTSEGTLEEFAYNNNGAGTSLQETEEHEDDSKISVSSSAEDSEEAHLDPEQHVAVEFVDEVESEGIATTLHGPEPDIAEAPAEDLAAPTEAMKEEYIIEDEVVFDDRVDESAHHDEDIAVQPEGRDTPEIFEDIREKYPKKHSDTHELRQRIDDLAQQLERTEEEKYFLQERFAAQISQHKAHEESLQHEIAEVYHDKVELEKRLQHDVVGASTDTREQPKTVDGARYDALVEKIEQKKTQIEHHVHALLKKRETSGRFLNQEIATLNTTKQRLQENLEHIQHIKTRVETKIHTELHQAREDVENLTKTSQRLEAQLHSQQQREQALRKQFHTLRRQKEKLQEEYDATLETLQQEKTELEQQLQEMTSAKTAIEKTLKKKLRALQRLHQQLKEEHKTVIELKDAQLQEHAQQLHDVTEKYTKLEKILADIRKERDRLNTKLGEETAAREMLEDKLLTIEKHVDALDAQEEKLLNQLGQELERHFTMEQHVTNKFQLSLDELEGLLALQEQEIHSLEAV